MNSRLVFSASALLIGALGVSIIFLPEELLKHFNVIFDQNTLLLMQLIGALYFGFAMMNWMARGHLAGGIYGRPIVIGNMTHFMIVSISLLKSISIDMNIEILILFVLYGIFAGLFTYMFFTTPKKVKENS